LRAGYACSSAPTFGWTKQGFCSHQFWFERRSLFVLASNVKSLAQINKSPELGEATNCRSRQDKEMNMSDDLRKDLLAIVLEEAFDYDKARIRNWLAGRFDQNDCVTENDISALQTASLIIDRIESRCSQELAPIKRFGRAQRN
jgi:hypothetical protein